MITISRHFLLVTALFASAAFAMPNLTGEYQCSGQDSHDGAYNHKLFITPDVKASAPERDFGAYQFTTEIHKGYIAAQGDAYALYFEPKDKKALGDSKDFGVGIVTVTHAMDKNGKDTLTLHSSYYQPEYQRDKNGGRGLATCLKVK
jgi:hypothetical protein